MEKLQAPAILSKRQEEAMRKRFGRDGILEEGDYQEPDDSDKGPTLAQ